MLEDANRLLILFIKIGFSALHTTLPRVCVCVCVLAGMLDGSFSQWGQI